MYTEMPVDLRSRIESLLNTDNFTAAKDLYDYLHGDLNIYSRPGSYTEQVKKIVENKRETCTTK